MGKEIAAVTDLSVTEGRRTLLGPVTAALQEGDFCGVVGPNGAGKTTLLHVFARLRSFSNGSLQLLGHPMSASSRRTPRSLRSQIGLLFQQQGFSSDLPFTVRDIVLLGRVGNTAWFRPYGAGDRAKCEEALQALGIEDLGNRLYRELSGGEQRKVQLARLVAQEARLLLLDEPTAGLDLDWQERLTHILQSLYELRKCTVIMVTHEIDRLPACCNQAILIREGRIVAAGPPQRVFRAEVLSQLYGCDVRVEHQDGRYHVFSRTTPRPDSFHPHGSARKG
jgi:ABC-type cobalamin/Fe3+-siderophores transport system ATPase subunit